MSMPVSNLRTILLSGLPIILLLAAIAVVVYQVMNTKEFPTQRRLALHQAFQDIPEGEDIFGSFKQHVTKQIQIVRDPFIRPASTRKESDQPMERLEDVELVEVKLTTIARGIRGDYCMLNGNIFQEGGKGAGFTVQTIDADHIVLATTSERFIMQPGEKVTLESGKRVNSEDKNSKAGINESRQE